MSNRIRYHFDEHIPNTVAKALRQYGIDVTLPSEVGLRQAEDHVHLEYARQTGRVMVTFDNDFLRLHARGIEHAGIAFVGPAGRQLKPLIEMLRLLSELLTADEMRNHTEYI